MLLMNNSNNCEEHYEQGGEGQGLLKSVSELVLFDDTVKGSQQDDDHQAD